MKTEHKELLLKDLCARLFYGVKVYNDIQGDFTLIGLTKERVFTTCEVEGCHNDFPIELIKPYLFPLSSMTEEQKKELYDKLIELELKSLNDEISRIEVVKFEIEYYLKNHLDYKGLILLDLAIDATNKNIY